MTNEGAVVAATVGSAVGIAPAAMASAKAGPFARRRAGPSGAAGGLALPSIGEMGALARRSDLLLAIGVTSILVVLVFPLPAVLLDLLLAVSIIVSVLILMTSLFIEEPLEFSSFPTVLLIATMLRLALNLASTRLILARGHEGTAAAGHVIEAFGHFVMGGNFVIGVIVFAILIIVNFVVITKGSGRIAEVAARFTLDAMPGKQMADTLPHIAGPSQATDNRLLSAHKARVARRSTAHRMATNGRVRHRKSPQRSPQCRPCSG